MNPQFFTFYTIAAGLVGLSIGSFLNVCVYRLPRECMSLVKPRSRCPKCLNGIAWYDNVPVLSWAVLLRGKCRHCKTPISFRYPLVELITGALFAFAAWQTLEGVGRAGLAAALCVLIVKLYLVCALLVAALIDLEWRIIPDEITKSGMLLAPIAGAAFPQIYSFGNFDYLPDEVIPNPHLAGFAAALIGMAAGGGFTWAVGLLGKILFRKQAMGFGDVKYMAFLGGFLGGVHIIIVFLLACFLGSIFGLLSMLITKDRYVAFGPYLSLGAMAVIFFADTIHAGIRWYTNMLSPAPF